MNKITLVAILFIVFSLSACTNPPPTLEPTEAAAVVAEVVVTDTAVSPTNTPSPSPTSLPTQTLQPTVTATATPWLTVTPPATQIDFFPRSEDVGLEIVNQIGGAVTAVAVQNDLAYMGIGSRLAVADVSDPKQPNIVSWSSILPGIAEQITIHDHLAYIALGNAGLWIFDISDPTTLTLLGHVQTTIPARQFLLHDDLAYIIDTSSSREPGQILSVVDVSDLIQPQEISQFSLPSRATKLVLVDGYLYVSIYPYHADYEDTLLIVDISDPTSLELVTAVPELAGIDMIGFDNRIMLTRARTNWLTIINTDDPIQPTEINSDFPTGFFGGSNLHLNEKTLFVASTFSDAGYCSAGISVFDISDINNIHDLGGINAGDCGTPQIAIANNYLYMATNSGLSIVDIKNPASMVLLGKLPTIPPFDQLAIDEDLYAMGRQGNGFRVFDFNLADPINPQVAGQYDDQYLVNDFVVNDSQAYIGTNWRGIVAIDMSDPTNPKEMAVTTPEDRAENGNNLILSGDQLYASLDGNLGVFDPDTLEWIGEYKPEAYGIYHSLVVDDNTLWAWLQMTDKEGVFTYDTTVPNQLTQIGFLSLNTEASSKELFLNQGYLYILSYCAFSSCEETTLSIIDTTTPSAMKFITTLPVPNTVRTIAMSNDNLFLVGDDLWLVDITDPTQPQINGRFATPGNAQDAVIVNDLIYLADGAGGLLVLKLKE